MGIAFLFSSSHLPASRVRRPDLEDEDNDENPEAMPRSGGVRASSHLEGRVAEPETARSAGGSPAPRSGGAGIDWMARLKELAEHQQRRRADSAAPDSGPRRADEEHEPDAGADHDEDEIPGGVHDEAPEHGEHDDTSSWYHPPESRSYHPDSGFNVRPEDIGHVSSDPGFHIRSEDIGAASPDTGFYQHLSEIKGEDKPAQRAGRPPSSSPDWSGRQSNLGRALPQGGQRSVGPDAPSGSVPASGRTGAFPNSRLFEMRPHPALATRPASISSTAQHAQSGPNQSRGNLQGLFPNVPAAPATQYSAQAKTGAQQAGATSTTQSPKGQKAAPVPAPAPGSPKAAGPAQGTQPPQAAGSLARYRQQRQKLLDALNAKKNPSPDEAKKIQKQIASITRNMESIELAAHLINHTKQKGEADIDPESIDENSADFKSRARTGCTAAQHLGWIVWLKISGRGKEQLAEVKTHPSKICSLASLWAN